MLAHLKAKNRDFTNTDSGNGCDGPASPGAAAEASPPTSDRKPPAVVCGGDDDDEKAATQMTCDVLCSLSSSYPTPRGGGGGCGSDSPEEESVNSFMCGGGSCGSGGEKRKGKSSSCPKQHQLPMFLSSTYFFRMSEYLCSCPDQDSVFSLGFRTRATRQWNRIFKDSGILVIISV